MKQQLEDLRRRLEEDEASKLRALAEKEASLQAEWEALEKAKRAAADLEETQVGWGSLCWGTCANGTVWTVSHAGGHASVVATPVL